MPSFSYEAITKQGDSFVGKISAASREEAFDKLREANITVTDLIEEKTKAIKKAKGKVSLADLSLFSRQVAAMISAGIPVTQALQTLSTQTANATLAAAITQIAQDVEGGSNLSDAFSQQGHIFSELYCSMIAAGETGGMLEKTLSALAVQLQKDRQLKEAVKSATTYPKMIGVFAIVLLIAMLVVMVPIFEGMIPDTVELNPITSAVFTLSGSIRAKYFFYIAGAILGFLGAKFGRKTAVAHRIWENNKMKLPLVGELISKTVLARFCRILATLLNGGVTAVQALESAGPTSGSDLISAAVKIAITEIENGRSINEALQDSGLFPPMLISMIAIGEEAGTLPSMLDKVAEFFEEDVESLSKNLGTALEPISLIMIGVVVGTMLISLYLPVFQATTASGS